MLRGARVVARTARPRCLSGGAPTKHGVSQELRPIHQDMPPPDKRRRGGTRLATTRALRNMTCVK